jgi:very-short-patch-repair endonuclease
VTASKRLRGVSSEMQIAARALRLRQTEAEAVLWQELRGGKLAGLKFRRQHAVATFVVDFYCPEHHLVIEVDGSMHDEPEQRIRDRTKQEYLEALGNTVLRVRNEEVTKNLAIVLERVRVTAMNAGEVPPFPPGRGKGAGG